MSNSFIETATEVEASHASKMKGTAFLREVVNLRENGEHRAEQETMVEAVENAIQNKSHLLVQAGTGTGKSIGYLIPAILSGQRVAISTATKQLSEQIVNKDMPFLNNARMKIEGLDIDYALIKGRNNYVCWRKVDEIERLDKEGQSKFGDTPDEDQGELELFAVEAPKPRAKATGKKNSKIKTKVEEAKQVQIEVSQVLEWSRRSASGDRSEGPAVSDKTWASVSSTNAECPGRSSCPFGDTCFAEAARDRAREAQVVVANHAVVGVDMLAESRILGDRDVLVVDEVHELDNYLSSAWGTEMSIKSVADIVSSSRRAANANDTTARREIDKLADLTDEFELALTKVESGLIETLDRDIERLLTTIAEVTVRLGLAFASASEKAESKTIKGTYKSASSRALELNQSAQMLLSTSEEVVRWYYRSDRDPDNTPVTLHAAPLRIGPKLMSYLKEAETTLIATSATITVGGKFDSMVQDLALAEGIKAWDGDLDSPPLYQPTAFDTIDVGTPFDYANQAMMYIPSADEFPAPVGKERQEHNDAVLESALELVRAANGRALILSTTTYGAKRIGEHLRDNLDVEVLIQGEAPNAQLTDRFRDEENSVLSATMGMWHGLDIVGPSCSLVIMDKIPFKPMNDPLSTARQRYADKNGRNGFMDVYVAGANIMLSQGFGRLVRAKTDKGVVAVLDTRLRTKAYGQSMRKSLPPVRVFSDEEAVTAALKRLTSQYDK